MNYVVNRLTEPSTWAGIASFVALITPSLGAGTVGYAVGLIGVIASAIAGFMKDHGAPDKAS